MLKQYRQTVIGWSWFEAYSATKGLRWMLDCALRIGDELAPPAPTRRSRRARLCSSPMILMPFA